MNTATKADIRSDAQPSCVNSGQWNISSFFFQTVFCCFASWYFEVSLLKFCVLLKSFKDYVVFLEASGALFYKEGLSISLKGFCFASILRKMFKFWMITVISGFTYSYLPNKRSLVLSRGFDFPGNVLLNVFKDNGDEE